MRVSNQDKEWTLGRLRRKIYLQESAILRTIFKIMKDDTGCEINTALLRNQNLNKKYFYKEKKDVGCVSSECFKNNSDNENI